jgi:hypothetical protein
MPLTEFQAEIASLLAKNRSPDSYLAGGAALHFEPRTKRYSNDLDFFHDSAERVATAFDEDRKLLDKNGFAVNLQMSQPGFIRAVVAKNSQSTKVEWSHDSSWRFMPTVYQKQCGYMLHPVDIAVSKALALAGRNEARDLLDVLMIHREILPLGALCWAAAGKDPGFTPNSLLELLRRKRISRAEEFEKLRLTERVNLEELKVEWLRALDEAEAFIASRPGNEVGCLYYSWAKKTFVAPTGREPPGEVVPHHGCPGGVLPKLVD